MILALNTVLCGEASAQLATLPADSIDCFVCSPPYWRHRDYGTPGQLGRELTPQLYVANLCRIMSQVLRVLKPSGTCWLNLGDTYSTGGNGGGGSFQAERRSWGPAKELKGWRSPPPGLKRKELCGIPWRTAFAMQDSGWFLRSEIIWSKPNPMPSSVKDRPTTSHETIFLMTKRPVYFYDHEAIREASSQLFSILKQSPPVNAPTAKRLRGHNKPQSGLYGNWDRMSKAEQAQRGHNKRTVWNVAPSTFKGAHFATFPKRLVEPCILAGCPAGGIVLDPFAGSGTTLEVAEELGRNWVGVEINPDYVTLIDQRMAASRAKRAIARREDGGARCRGGGMN